MKESSKLLEKLIHQKGKNGFGIELATVISPPPELKIRIDNMTLNLEGDDLIVCEHLLDHEREYSTISAIADSDMSTWSESPPHQSHTHNHKVLSITAARQKIIIHTKLKEGDRVVAMALPGGQQYLIWDKVVVM